MIKRALASLGLGLGRHAAPVAALAPPAPAGDRAAELLREINRDVPPGVDWKAGAHGYVARYREEWGDAELERYVLSKPMVALDPADATGAALVEGVSYLENFTNLVRLLRLPGGASFLDVACGGGWLAHYLSRLNYAVWGFDLSADFASLARRRIASDPLVPPARADGLAERFVAHDIEALPLPDGFGPPAGFDAVVLESCLHHFLDPVTALRHLERVLARDGLVVLVEGENRRGPIREEYLAVMRDTHTLERPYPRELLREALRLAGLPAVEFCGATPGWVGARDPRAPAWTQVLADATEGMNLAVCARSPGALARVFPYLAPGPDAAGAL